MPRVVSRSVPAQEATSATRSRRPRPRRGGHRFAAARRHRAGDRRTAGPGRPGEGVDDAGRPGHGQQPCRTRWAPHVTSRAGRWPTRRRASPSSAARAGFVGAVADDEVGRTYAENLRAAGVEFEPHLSESAAGDGLGTGRCVVLVITEDADRTMGTYLGAAVDLDAGRGPDALRGPCLHRAPRGLPVGRAGGQGGHAPRRGDRPRRRGLGGPLPVGSRSAWDATSASSSTSCSTTWTSCSATRRRSPCSSAPTRTTRRVGGGRGDRAARRHDPGRAGCHRADRPGTRGGPGRGRWRRWSTPPAPGTSSPPGSSSASRTAWARSRAPGSARCAPPR